MRSVPTFVGVPDDPGRTVVAVVGDHVRLAELTLAAAPVAEQSHQRPAAENPHSGRKSLELGKSLGGLVRQGARVGPLATPELVEALAAQICPLGGRVVEVG